MPALALLFAYTVGKPQPEQSAADGATVVFQPLTLVGIDPERMRDPAGYDSRERERIAALKADVGPVAVR